MTSQLLEKFEKPGASGATMHWCQKLIALYPELADDGETSGEKTVKLFNFLQLKIYWHRKHCETKFATEFAISGITIKALSRSAAESTECVQEADARDALPWSVEEHAQENETNLSSSTSGDEIEAALNESRQQTLDSDVVMKARLKHRFDSLDWGKTFKLRQTEIKSGWPTLSLKSHWPYLFKREWVI